MPEETDDPPQPPPEQSTLLGNLAPDEMFARGMQSAKMTSGTAGTWQPPTIEETARLFPDYAVIKLLGRGGMGAVYQARQIELDRLVAIKLLPLEISVDKDFADRFRREARAMARLNHPNIVSVHDFGTTGEGHLYFVMEFVEGANLADILHQVSLTGEQALSIVEQVCTALTYAHGKGIVHRDIKPANVMLDAESHVKVADFGLARLTDSGATDLGHTTTGAVMGTPDYMAPEQMRGMNVDHRADIYSLGVMAYEMLCREVPRGAFEPPSVRGGCDPRIDPIVLRAMQPNPERRYQSTQEMKTDVTAARTALPGAAGAPWVASAPPPKPPQALAKPAALNAIPLPVPAKSKTPFYAGIAVVVAAMALFIFKPKPGPLTGAQAHATQPAGGPLDKPVNAASASPSPEGASTPATATRDVPLENSLGMKFVPVPILGGPTGGKTVLFSVWDTRAQDYGVFTEETKRLWPKPEFLQAPTHPAVDVSWEDAQLFCQWLTLREQAAGRLPAEWRYRLPSDHEWSCAVELGAREDAAKLPAEKNDKIGTVFPWGTQWPPPEKAGNYASEELRPLLAAGKYTWIKVVLPDYHDGFAETSPVASFAANRFGLFDMGGNVQQWCEDWFDRQQKERVQRGASWICAGRDLLLSSRRDHDAPGRRINSYGFRCVLAPASATSTLSATAAPVPAVSNTTAAATKDAPMVGGAALAVASTPSPDAVPVPAPQPRTLPSSAPATAPLSTPVPSTPTPSVASKTATDVEKWLAQVDGPQEEAFQKQVLKPFEVGKAGLRAQYLTSLDAAIARASSAAQLTEALMWRTERQTMEKAQNVAADGADTPTAVKTLRAAFRQEFARLEQVRMAKARALLAPYDAILAKNEALLTQRQRLDDALFLKTKREEIAVAWLGSSPATSSGTTGHAELAKSGAVLVAGKDQSFVNSLGMEFVPVPIAGGPTNGKRVLFSVWDTRVQDYEVFVKETGHEWPKASFKQGPTHPAVSASWDDAQAFCVWLTDRERAAGKIGGQDSYRLPSDHEWSCAVGIGEREKAETNPELKSGNITSYPWGTQWPPPKGGGNFAGEEMRAAMAAGNYPNFKDVIAGYQDDFVETAPVGSFAANRFGLFDMAGNAWQWCEDWFNKDQAERVLRGGSWNVGRRDVLASSHRWREAPGARSYSNGFRCVLAVAGR